MQGFYHQAAQAHDRSVEVATEAQQHRLAKLCQSEQSQWMEQVLANVGDVLVGVGTRLQKRRAKPSFYRLEKHELHSS